ncbi:SPARC-like protein [Dinothrombium tinctorium]|uniref:SPARC-like protein n=1 Tax=Dinothrombium tinctorium TaxID=1965070 RepID=A0A3S3NSG9_9ACAR|nr:SPARC-like protein [Dinothrombium tinctorium]RWS05536.1 SPARC-like protein [Dinothrombium tinctorium]RWS08340.1 SPARC-like protein [Dinothrombium tinctorium]
MSMYSFLCSLKNFSSECPINTDARRKVCSNLNTTWESDCHLFKHRCNCLEGLSDDCRPIDKHLHINYYGECRHIPECQESVLNDFPRRMRDWLYRIMNTKHSINKTEAVTMGDQLSSEWVLAIIWKYCDLDTHPSDSLFKRASHFLSSHSPSAFHSIFTSSSSSSYARFVSRHELFPLRAPLLSMEPCITNFLDNCDANDDHKITLIEWGKCLGAPEGKFPPPTPAFRF